MTNTMTAPTDDHTLILIAKVEKMWRRANHPNTPPAEREAAQAKALSLMEKHRITQAMIADADPEDILGDHPYGKVSGSYGRVHLTFINHVANAFDCRLWWRNFGKTYDVYLTGFKSDANKVKTLAHFLLTEAVNGAMAGKSTSMAATIDYRRTFIEAFGYEISRRLREAAQYAKNQAEAEGDVTGAALVLVDRKERVNEFYAKKGVRSAGRTRSSWSARGRADGAAAGRSVSLSGGSNGVGRGVKALTR